MRILGFFGHASSKWKSSIISLCIECDTLEKWKSLFSNTQINRIIILGWDLRLINCQFFIWSHMGGNMVQCVCECESMNFDQASGQCWRRQWHPAPVLLPGKSHGWRSLVGCSPRGCLESDTTERLHFHVLEKEMATYSSVLAWRIPGTGSLVGCCLWGRTELDTTEVTQQQQQQWSVWGGSILCLLQTLYTAYIRSPADINTDRDNIKHRCQLSKQLNNFTVYNMQWRFKS